MLPLPVDDCLDDIGSITSAVSRAPGTVKNVAVRVTLNVPV